MAQSEFELPKPSNNKTFEQMCCDLFERIWEDPNTALQGRSGQGQKGVDIVGQPKGGDGYSAVQCKLSNKNLTEKQILEEVEKAKEITPPLRELIFATTAPNDINAQEVARKISDRHKTIGLFRVEVLGWSELVRRFFRYPELLRDYWPQFYWPGAGPGTSGRVEIADTRISDDTSIQVQHRQTETSISAIQRELALIQADTEQRDAALSTVLTGQLDESRDLIDAHKERAALGLLRRLKSTAWESATDYDKFRTLTNMGAAHLNLCEYDEASKHFNEALAFAPGDEKALCNVATASLVVGNIPAALSEAQEAQRKFPDSPRANALLLAASYHQDDSIDPLAVPEKSTLDSAEVTYSIGSVFRSQGDLDRAVDYFRRSHKLDPENLDVCKGYGAAILERLESRDYLRTVGRPVGDDATNLELAIGLLREVWEKVKGTDIHGRAVDVALNLGFALRIDGDVEGSLDLMREIPENSPEYPEVLRRSGALMLQLGQFDRLAKMIESKPTTQFPARGLIYGEALFRLERYAEIPQVIDEYLDTDPEPTLRSMAEGLRVSALARTEGLDAIDAFFSEQSLTIHTAEAASQAARAQEDQERAVSYALRAADLLDANSSVEDRIVIGNLLSGVREFDRALAVYDQVAYLPHPNSSTRGHLIALYETDRRAAGLAILDSLPPDESSDRFYLRMAAGFHNKAGDPAKALELISKYLELDPADVELHLLRIWLLQRTSANDDEIRAFVRLTADLDQGTPIQRMQVARLVAHYIDLEEGRAVAYSLLREFQGQDPQIEIGYQSLYLLNNDQAISIPTQVDSDSAVTVKFADGTSRDFIIEIQAPIRTDRNEVQINTDIAKSLIGRKLDDEVEIPLNEYNKQKGAVSGIKHKRLYALHKSMEEYPHRYPGNQAMMSISIDPSSPVEERFKAIIDITRKRQEAIDQAISLYREQKAPIAIVAPMIGATPVEFAVGIMNSEEVKFTSCIGNLDERNSAFEQIRTKKGSFVVDAITLYMMWQFGIHEALTKVLGTLNVCQSTLDSFGQIAADLELHKNKGQGKLTIGMKDGQLTRFEATRAEVDQSLENIQQLIEWTQTNCNLVRAVPRSEIESSEGRQLLELLDKAYSDSILAAHGLDGALLCDDLFLRQVATRYFDLEGVWTQPVLMVARDDGEIDTAGYSQAILKQLWAKYYYVSIDTNTLLWLAEENDWAVTDSFKRALSAIAQPGTIDQSIASVTGGFLAELWKAGVSEDAKRRFIFAVLNALTFDGKGDVWDTVTNITAVFAVTLGNQHAARLLTPILAEWARGHFLSLSVGS